MPEAMGTSRVADFRPLRRRPARRQHRNSFTPRMVRTYSVCGAGEMIILEEKLDFLKNIT